MNFRIGLPDLTTEGGRKGDWPGPAHAAHEERMIRPSPNPKSTLNTFSSA